MALFGIRFDFRNPPVAATTMTERYKAALDMVEWADGLGFLVVGLSEHHGSSDGYLPSPLPMAAAFAARSNQIRINVAAMVASFHDPLRLAEDIAVVDCIAGGRIDIVLTNGYVESEFAMFDRKLSERAERTAHAVHTLRKAWTGEPFEYQGRTVQVTPAPHQPGGPALTMGGSTEPAARRAARIGDGFLPSSPPVWQYYRDERIALGKTDPGPYLGADTSFFHVSTDPEGDWRRIAPFALHEVNAYGESMAQAGVAGIGGYSPIADADSLRDTGQYRVVTPDELLAEIQHKGEFGFTMFHPLMGGIPPEIGWESLRLFESAVLPRL